MWRTLRKAKPVLAKLYGRLGEPPAPNLKGDRDVEYSWILAHLPPGPGAALDFGCGPSYLGLVAARKGYQVTCVDLLPVTWYYEHPNLKFLQGDARELSLPSEHYDLIINCSSIEHVGLAERYGVQSSQEQADIETSGFLRQLLKPGKPMLLTVPVGKDQVFPLLHRVYGQNRLPMLLSGWEVASKEFWVKNNSNCWVAVPEKEALNYQASDYVYGLGLFVLLRPASGPTAEQTM